MIPSPEAVSAFMASLRAAEVQHSPGVGGGTRPSHFAASSQSGSPEVSTPKSGVSTSRPNAAAVAAFALSRSGLLGHPGPSRPSPPEAPDVARRAPILAVRRRRSKRHARRGSGRGGVCESEPTRG